MERVAKDCDMLMRLTHRAPGILDPTEPGHKHPGQVSVERVAAQSPPVKWKRPVETAIDQIRARNYPQALLGLDVPILLGGITYDSKTREHHCATEALEGLE